MTAEVIGTRRLFDWVDRNPLVRLAPASYTHGLAVLSRCSLLRAVNSAVQVALDGSINAESVGGRLISGAGGQPDFAEAALWAEDAISFVAMPSTAAGGRVSRIVSSLDEGAVVAVARHTSDRVVTEYGVADLRGLPLSLRADAPPRDRRSALPGRAGVTGAPVWRAVRRAARHPIAYCVRIGAVASMARAACDGRTLWLFPR